MPDSFILLWKIMHGLFEKCLRFGMNLVMMMQDHVRFLWYLHDSFKISQAVLGYFL